MNRSVGNFASLSLLVLSLLVLLAVGPASADDSSSTCFSGFDERSVIDFSIPGCSCHPSCATCGYDAAPTGERDCITCADGSDVTEVFPDGTGTCGELVASTSEDEETSTSEDEENKEKSSDINPSSTCYSGYGAVDVGSAGRYGVVVPDCSCWFSCATCYYEFAEFGFSCYTCRDGSDLSDAIDFPGVGITGTCPDFIVSGASHLSVLGAANWIAVIAAIFV